MPGILNLLGLLVILLIPGPLLAQSPPETGRPNWTLAFTQPEAARTSMNMAFDPGRQVIVMFGGRAGDLVFSDTYEYAQTIWNKVLTPHSPPARYWAGMAYDGRRQRMVLFGGTDYATTFNDTWEYDGVDWTSTPTAHSPPAQDALAMAYDSCREKILLLGVQSETWEYDGIDWAKVITADAPPGRRLAAMIFDPSRCRTILFGGLPAEGPLIALSDTWEYDGTNWTRIKLRMSPPGRWAHAMVYDTNRRRAVLFGGYGPVYPEGTQTNDTWEYNGHAWVQVFPQYSPGPREQHGMAYDLTRQCTVLFGGGGGPAEAWEYKQHPVGPPDHAGKP